jgi:hypothetical protein
MAPFLRTRRLTLLALFAALVAANRTAGAKEPTPLQHSAGCVPGEPDSVEIN